jgi:hypothetical protein
MRKPLLFLAVLLFYAIPSHAQTFVRHGSLCTTLSGTSITCSFSTNAAHDSILFVGYIATGAPTTSMTDSAGNSYTQVLLNNCSSAGKALVIFEADNIVTSTGTNTITWNFSATGGAAEGEAFEYEGLAASAFDQFACTNLNGQTSPSSGNTPTTTQANELVFTYYVGGNLQVTSTDGTTRRSTDSFILFNNWGDKDVTSTGAYAATGTCSSQTVVMLVATFKAAAQPNFNPNSLVFGSQSVGTSSAAQSITLTNIGPLSLTSISVSIAGTNSGDFSQTNNCPGTLTSNASCAISVRFSPTAVGSRSATVSVSDNAPGSPQTVALSGNAISFFDPLKAVYIPSMDTNCAHAQYSASVWLTDTMQKVRQDAGTNPGSACTLTVYGTQNEFVDFQIHFHDSGSGTTGLSVTVNNFVQSSPNAGTINCATLGQCVNYREAYVNVNTYKTATGATYYNALGKYPDILIPKVDPYWGQTTNAWPLTVAAGNNQSAWVDIEVPPGASPGYYLGSVVVQTGCPASCTTISTNPVTIAVWDWYSGSMPSTATLKSNIGISGATYNAACIQMYDPTGQTVACSGYPNAASAGGGNDGANTIIWIDGDLIMKDHRYSVGGYENILPQSGSFATYYTPLMTPILSGGCVHGGTVCPLLGGSVNTAKGIVCSGGCNVNLPSQALWNNWQNNFDANNWGSAGNLPLYDYLSDEPHSAGDFSSLCTKATTRHGYSNPAIQELVTTDWVSANANSALNCIDIMIPPINILEPIGGPLQTLSNYTAWRSASNPAGATRLWWSYGACGSAGTCSNGTVGPSTYTYPNYDIDGKPAANRAMEWITYLHGQTGELYYGYDLCQAPFVYPNTITGCDPSGTYVNGWTSLYSYGNWGDGNLMYFGSNEVGSYNYMGAGVTTPIFLPSIRLKMIRDGVQDYEYLYKLNSLGYGSFVNTQITSWVTNSYTFETTGSGLQAARIALGNKLHSLSFAQNGNTPAAPSRSLILMGKAEEGTLIQ